MTHPHFRKFKIDWYILKHILSDQITAQLYNLCDDSVQNSIIDTVTDVFQQDESSYLQVIEHIVTKRSNPTVHHMHFGNFAQTPMESIQACLVRLKSAALDCEFSPILDYHCQCQNSPTKQQHPSTYPIVSLKYAAKRNEPLTVQMPSLLTCITIQLKTPTQTLPPIAQKKFLQI